MVEPSAPPVLERRVLVVMENLSFGEVKVVVVRERLRMGFWVRRFLVLGMGLEWSEAVVCCRDAIVGVEEGEKESVGCGNEMK
jgi:hypothetical protein